MLNISSNSIQQNVAKERYRSFGQTELPASNRLFKWWLLGTMGLILVLLMLPWTQNIQSKGKVTTLQPEQRPQTIHSTIAGRIERWYVREGQRISKGDTIVYLSEIKDEYFDPQLLARTANQVSAKEGAMVSYEQKASALAAQIEAMRQELELKTEQLQGKLRQTSLKVVSQEAELEQARIDADIADYQFRRADTLYRRGIVPLTELEGKRLKLQETRTKVVAAENKLLENQNEVEIARLDLSATRNEYLNKIAKAESERFSTISEQFDAEGSLQKLRNTLENYSRRSQFYYITAPQDCYITQVVTPGIGETVKEGEAIVSIMPAEYELAVELYIRPMDLPLIDLGREVRFLFDGWPAFIFSGWPDLSFGTYSGEMVTIDNTISPNGQYRILVSPNDPAKPWPTALRVGSGAQGIALLDRVPTWYEVWRRLNGFPPDFYTPKENQEKPKLKAPVKSVPK